MVAAVAAMAGPNAGGPLAVRVAERELRSRGRVAFWWWWVEVRLSCDGGWLRRPGHAVGQRHAAGGARHGYEMKCDERTVGKLIPSIGLPIVWKVMNVLNG